jgi:hypothetical protein
VIKNKWKYFSKWLKNEDFLFEFYPEKSHCTNFSTAYSKLSNAYHFLPSVRVKTLSNENDWKFFINRPWDRNSIWRDPEMTSMSCIFEPNPPILRTIVLTSETSDYSIQEFDNDGVSELRRTRRNIPESIWFSLSLSNCRSECNHLYYSKHMSGFVKQFCLDLWFSPSNFHHYALKPSSCWSSRTIDSLKQYCWRLGRSFSWGMADSAGVDGSIGWAEGPDYTRLYRDSEAPPFIWWR